MPILNSKTKIPTFSAAPNPRKGKATGFAGRYRCPKCKSLRTIKRGKRLKKVRKAKIFCRSCGYWFSRPIVNRKPKPIREIDAATVLHLLRSPIATLCPDADNSITVNERVTCIVDAPDAATLDLYREMGRSGAVVVREENGLVYVSLKANQ